MTISPYTITIRSGNPVVAKAKELTASLGLRPESLPYVLDGLVNITLADLFMTPPGERGREREQIMAGLSRLGQGGNMSQNEPELQAEEPPNSPPSSMEPGRYMLEVIASHKVQGRVFSRIAKYSTYQGAKKHMLKTLVSIPGVIKVIANIYDRQGSQKPILLPEAIKRTKEAPLTQLDLEDYTKQYLKEFRQRCNLNRLKPTVIR